MGAVLSGVCAGVLGLQALYGFLFYVVVSLALSLMLKVAAGSESDKYFPKQSVSLCTLEESICKQASTGHARTKAALVVSVWLLLSFFGPSSLSL